MKHRSVIVICLLAIVLSLAVTQSPTQAQGATITGTVIAGKLRVRDLDSTHGKILTMVNRNAVLTILGTDTKRTWLKVRTPDGMTGWVSTVWVKFQGAKLKALPLAQ